MKAFPLIQLLIQTLFMIGAIASAMAGMETMTDHQMGLVQGLSGTIVSTRHLQPKSLEAVDTPGLVNTIGVQLKDSANQVFSPGSLAKDIHPTGSSPDVLFAIHMNVSRVTYRENNTRMVEAWDGNRVDFQSVFTDMNR
ncbi:hypothetical protein [uncultured Desulfosarcina sp.]|uniref:hypothetical protein n=1 Tax=uncultured Desulfosarcina sp. TaxID=218289 RepID=UPI0029C65C5D|nr:hypothetical protein [uncultured Desulfosarcina sp.]